LKLRKVVFSTISPRFFERLEWSDPHRLGSYGAEVRIPHQ
jgi:hypothetical protein